MATPRKKATETQRKAYLKALREGKPLPEGFVWNGVHLFVSSDAKEDAEQDDDKGKQDSTS